MRHRTTPPRPPVAPPGNAEEGAERIQAAAVKLFDRNDGHGADWRMMCLSLFLAGLRMLEKLPEDDRRKIAGRVQERVYPYSLPGALEVDSSASNSSPDRAGSGPTNTAAPKANGPRPPH